MAPTNSKPRSHASAADTTKAVDHFMGALTHCSKSEIAKFREIPPGGLAIDDPEKLLKWLAEDRAAVAFKDMNDFNAKKAAFLSIIRSWITYV